MSRPVSQCPIFQGDSVMMKVQMRTFRMPGWLLPIFVLLGLALIPIAFFLALALLGLALGSVLVCALLPSVHPHEKNENIFSKKHHSQFSDKSVLDVEYEVKDDHEKIQRN
jgi:hypothetical protein